MAKAIAHEEDVRAVIRDELKDFLGGVESVDIDETSEVELEFLDAGVFVPPTPEISKRFDQDEIVQLKATIDALRKVVIAFGFAVESEGEETSVTNDVAPEKTEKDSAPVEVPKPADTPKVEVPVPDKTAAAAPVPAVPDASPAKDDQ